MRVATCGSRMARYPGDRVRHNVSIMGRRAQVPLGELAREARERFGARRFRPGQREVLEAVREGRATGPSVAAPLAILAAHPDDETLGASSLLAVPGCAVIHLTDGAPADPRLRAPGWQASRLEYALARRGELLEALGLAGVPPARIHALGAADQGAVDGLVPLARALARLLEALRPARLVTHAYEGGHPDHDAAALVARGACGILARGGAPAPRLFEMACYHGGPGRLVPFEFLPGTAKVRTRRLDGAARRRKQEMLARFASQRDVLGWFPVLDAERYRRAPPADFSRPPHPGPLWYERLGFGASPERWRSLAVHALRALERERPG